MKLVEHAKEGLRNLFFAKLRTMLALLGVLVGTASVVAMVLGGELATNEALKQFKSLGTDLLAVSITTAADTDMMSLDKINNVTLTQAISLAHADKNILGSAPYTQLFYPVYYDSQPLNTVILGVTDSFADILKIKLTQGRFVSVADQYSFFCVIGHEIYNKIKQLSSREPLGQQIQVGRHIFVIVGVADAWPENNFVNASVDNAIMIPLMASFTLSKYAAITNIIMQLAPKSDIPQIESHLSAKMDAMQLSKQLNYRSAKELIARMQKQSDILTVFLGLIGSVSLLVGGIGVMNIMLVSVVERRREIGIRLAVGATPSDIRALFLLEAIMLSLVGGVMGVVLGVIIAYIIALAWHWQFILFLWPPIVGFSVSVMVGIFFGFYPAYLASRLDPIEALRSE